MFPQEEDSMGYVLSRAVSPFCYFLHTVWDWTVVAFPPLVLRFTKQTFYQYACELFREEITDTTFGTEAVIFNNLISTKPKLTASFLSRYDLEWADSLLQWPILLQAVMMLHTEYLYLLKQECCETKATLLILWQLTAQCLQVPLSPQEWECQKTIRITVLGDIPQKQNIIV